MPPNVDYTTLPTTIKFQFLYFSEQHDAGAARQPACRNMVVQPVLTSNVVIQDHERCNTSATSTAQLPSARHVLLEHADRKQWMSCQIMRER